MTALEGLKLQNLAFADMTGLVVRSQPKNITADVQYAVNKRESLGSGKQLIRQGNPSAIAKDCSSHKAVLRRHFLPNMYFQCYLLLQGTLDGNFDIFAASDGSLD